MIKLELVGLPALLTALRSLPAELAGEASTLVVDHADIAETAIRSGYTAHWHTGNLAGHVETRTLASEALGAAVEVRSTARHARIFENGTEARHYITKKGKKHELGRMPPAKIFGPAMRRERARLYLDLAELLRRAGLDVTGLEDLTSAAG